MLLKLIADLEILSFIKFSLFSFKEFSNMLLDKYLEVKWRSIVIEMSLLTLFQRSASSLTISFP